MRRALCALAALVLVPAALSAQGFQADSAFLAAMRWRSIGPANMGGRVHDIEAIPQNPKVIYVAFATGGVWKSVNAGTTWQPVFDGSGAHAASDIAIAPSDTNVVWVGTGEVNSRNTVSPGQGIYKSTDGGRTWTHMGLRETQHISRIIVHPTDPNTVWVAALGQLWGTNRERGIYKTTDGGQTWRLVKFVSERAGFVDLAIDPTNPNVLFAAAWERIRGPWFLQSGGPGSGLWRTSDGGESWQQVRGNGLPTTTWGRSGIAIAPSNPNYVYLILEADSNPNPQSVRASRQRGYVPDTANQQRLQSGLFRSTDGGRSWERMNDQNNRPFYYSNVRVDPRNPERVYWISTQARYSNDGGRSYRTVGQGIHVDYHALWINPNDPEHYIIGQDGGVAQTFDRGRTYDAILQMAVGQFYAVSVDMQRPFWVCGGLQDNGSWCGPSNSLRGAIRNDEWFNIGGGDGFYTAQDPNDPDVVFYESQGGNIQRRNLRTWEGQGIRPGRFRVEGGGGFGGGMTLARMLRDSVIIARGDTTQPMTPGQRRIVDSLEARIAADTAVLTRDRWNWNSPFFLSPHNSQTMYFGGHKVWKSTNRGDAWLAISDDLSTRDTAKIRMGNALTGGVTRDVTNAENHGNVVALAESPIRPGILFAGTDDGNVWVTRNDGASWENLTGRFPGVPRNTWVSRVRPSSFDSMTVYVTFDGHRTNDFRPYAYVSNDFGRTFRPIVTGIPDNEYVNVITDNPRRRGLLFLGTELSAYVSTNGGESWQRFNGGLPPVPVHDLVVHPRDRQLVAGTHGRSIWIVDIGPLEQATEQLLAEPVAVFAPEPALMMANRGPGGGVGSRGHKQFQAQNPPDGVRIPIRILGTERQIARRPGADTAETEEGGPQFGFGGGGGGGGFGGGGGLLQLLMGGGGRAQGDTVMVVVTDVRGDTVRTMYTNARPSALRWVTWNMRRDPSPRSPASVQDSVRAANRLAHLRDSLRTAAGGQAGAGGPGGLRALFRDPEPGEPGQYNNPVQAAIGGGGGGFGGGFGGLGGGQGALVEPGTYLVTIRINGRDYKQVAQIVRPEQTSALSGGWQ